MTERRTIKAVWDDYRTKVIPRDAGPVQVEACRRSFYAGALAFFNCMMGGLDPGEDATPSDVAHLDALNKELQQFLADVSHKAGRYRQ